MSVFGRGELPTFSGEIGPEERRAGALWYYGGLSGWKKISQ